VLDDVSLLARSRGGNEGAFTQLYDRYSAVVYSVALRVVKDSGVAEDILQEIFIQFWRQPQLFDNARGNLGPWLAVVSRNRAIDWLRKQRPQASLDEFDLVAPADVEDEAVRNGCMLKVRRALHSLPAEQRRPLEMAFFEGLTHSEIAARTGDPLGTVKTRSAGRSFCGCAAIWLCWRFPRLQSKRRPAAAPACWPRCAGKRPKPGWHPRSAGGRRWRRSASCCWRRSPLDSG
jgi:RNA polymerase sigma-70 factor (ECF subfamily)